MTRQRRSFGSASSQLGKRRAGQTAIKNSISAKVGQDIRQRLNTGARRAAAEIMNRLAEKGPAYSGKFRDQWRAIPVGSAAGAAKGGKYPYETSDVPNLSTSLKEVKRAKVLTIENIAKYAAIALDLDPPDEKPFFINPGTEPKGGIESGVIRGRRYGAIRGQVRPFTAEENQNMEDAANNGESVRAPNISTAELNWYTNFMRSGEVDKEVERAFRFAFSPSSSPAPDYNTVMQNRKQ
jgi:hypothetical protein